MSLLSVLTSRRSRQVPMMFVGPAPRPRYLPHTFRTSAACPQVPLRLRTRASLNGVGDFPDKEAESFFGDGDQANGLHDIGAGHEDVLEIEVGFPSSRELLWCDNSDVQGDPSELPECNPAFKFSELRVSQRFVDTFRMSSPYISAYRGLLFVVHIPGVLLDDETRFTSVLQDVALLHTIGIRIVLVLGPQLQVLRRLEKAGIHDEMINDQRVTSPMSMQVIKEAAGDMMFEVERHLSRGVYNAPVAGRIRVCSGNFYSAQPIGVIDGKDYGLSGKVRKFDFEAIVNRLSEGGIVVMTNLGFSPSGEIFNCASESVASACAVQLEAEKLIYFVGGETVYSSTSARQIANLTLRTAKNFLATQRNLPAGFQQCLSNATWALDRGVRRAHLLNRFIDGVLLMEVFHRDGVGLMVSRDIYEGIRPARQTDLPGIIEVIEPLERKGVLVFRARDQLEKGLRDFVVVEREGMVVACAALNRFADDPSMAELACLAVHDSYRGSGKGAALLSYLERKAQVMGVSKLVILSTQSFQWFLERGFREKPIGSLPETKRTLYNHQRKSKIFLKQLTGGRTVDEEDVLTRL